MNMLCECYTRTQLTGCLHLDPAQFQHLSSALLALEEARKSKITLCAAICSPSSEAVLTLVVAMGVTFGPSPMAIYIEVEKVKAQKKTKVGLMDLKKKHLNTNVIIVIFISKIIMLKL